MKVNSRQSLYALLKDQPSDRISVNHRITMSWLSRAIELTALRASGPMRIFSGFQSMQFFLPVMKRYTALAQRAQVYVYGYPDITPPDVNGITYIQLEADDPLVREWFIVVDSPHFSNALSTEEETNQTLPHAQRRFKGLLTYKRDVVDRLTETLSHQINVPIAPKVETSINQRVMIMEMVEHLQEANPSFRSSPSLSRELMQIVNQYITPALL